MYISQDPIGLDGGIFNLYGYVGNTNAWNDIFGLIKIMRNMSEKELIKTIENKGLVPGKNSSKGAKWVSYIEKSYCSKGRIAVIFDVDDQIGELISNNTLNYEEMEGGESRNRNKILVKSNEPDAMGIGVDLLPKFNRYIKSITAYKIEKGRRKQIAYKKIK